MLRLGLAVLGVALILKHPKASSRQTEDQDGDSSDNSVPGAASPTRFGEPILDPALQSLFIDPLMRERLVSEEFTGNQPIDLHPPAEAFLYNQPGFGHQITGAEYAAATGQFGRILNSLPGAVRQQASNVQRLANFHRRLFRKVFG